MSIAVTGSTGELGGRVARRLSARGVEQLLLVRDPSRAPVQAPTFVIGGYDDDAAVQAALREADTLLFVPAGEETDRLAEHRRLVASASSAGIRHIVYFSFIGAAPDCTFVLGRDHFATEEMIRETGIDFTFLRMNFYLDSMPRWTGDDGVIRGPAGDGRLAACARDDMADVAVAVLTNLGSHRGKTYDLTGREAFSFSEATALMSRLSGKTITYADETIDEARASRAKYGAPDWQIDAWISTYTAIAAGDLAAVSDTVRKIAGHEPQTLSEFLADNPECLDHVAR